MSPRKAKNRAGESDQHSTTPAESDRVLPTPVRASMGEDPSEGPMADRTIEFEGRSWFVRVVGQSSGGRTLSNVGLLEMQFEPVDGTGDAVRRMVVCEVGRELSDLQLEELFAKSTSSVE